MKTIEERAKRASEGYDDDGYSAGLYTGYVEGATEQKAIDNEGAKNAFRKACGWLSTYTWYNAVVEEFVKVLEEEQLSNESQVL